MSTDRPVKQVIVLRHDLGMRYGKGAAQAAHAAMAWLTKRMRLFASMPRTYTLTLSEAEQAWVDGAFTKIVCRVESLDELEAVAVKAIDAGLLVNVITDAGRTEFAGKPTITALAIGPDYAGLIDPVTGELEPY